MSSSTASALSRSDCLIVPAGFEPKGSFPFLSLPLEIRWKVYAELLVPPSGTIDLSYTWVYSFGPRLRFDQQGPYVEPSILSVNKQISAEASRVLHREALLHLSCDESLRMPFPGIGMLKLPNREGEKMYSEVIRRFRKIRLTFLVGDVCYSEPDSRDITYYGHMYGYTIYEMNAGIKGFKQILGALATDVNSDGETEEPYDLGSKVRGILYLDLKWPNSRGVKRPTANAFIEHWKKQGVWDELARVEKVRSVKFGGTACATICPARCLGIRCWS